jgi:hypothetical protein
MYSDEVFSIEEFTSLKVQREMMIYHIRGIASEKGISFLEEVQKKYEN